MNAHKIIIVKNSRHYSIVPPLIVASKIPFNINWFWPIFTMIILETYLPIENSPRQATGISMQGTFIFIFACLKHLLLALDPAASRIDPASRRPASGCREYARYPFILTNLIVVADRFLATWLSRLRWTFCSQILSRHAVSLNYRSLC